MAHYRIFFIGSDDHIAKADILECPTDDDALARARLSCTAYPAVEVWELARRVGRVDNGEILGNAV